MKLNLPASGPTFPSILRYSNPELGESDAEDSMRYVPPRESTEEEMRKDGIQRPKGSIYCKRCGYYYDNWDEFFGYHKAKHPWEDPEVLKAAMVEAEKYLRWWQELIGIEWMNKEKTKFRYMKW